jgi:hypothetical protein
MTSYQLELLLHAAEKAELLAAQLPFWDCGKGHDWRWKSTDANLAENKVIYHYECARCFTGKTSERPIH